MRKRKRKPPLLLRNGISLGPLLGRLLEFLPVVLVLVPDAGLHGVVGVGFDEEIPGHVQDGADAVRRFPLVGAQHSKAHGAFVIVGDVWVVDFGGEGEDGRFERVVLGEGEGEGEGAALRRLAMADVSFFFTSFPCTNLLYVSFSLFLFLSVHEERCSAYVVRAFFGALHDDFPLVEIRLLLQLDLCTGGRVAGAFGQLLREKFFSQLWLNQNSWREGTVRDGAGAEARGRS